MAWLKNASLTRRYLYLSILMLRGFFSLPVFSLISNYSSFLILLLFVLIPSYLVSQPSTSFFQMLSPFFILVWQPLHSVLFVWSGYMKKGILFSVSWSNWLAVQLDHSSVDLVEKLVWGIELDVMAFSRTQSIWQRALVMEPARRAGYGCAVREWCSLVVNSI